MKLSRTLAEKTVAEWYVRQGAQVHRAEASFRRLPTGGSCAACHRRFERTFSVSHDLFGIFDGVSVWPNRLRAWWQVTTVSRKDATGPRGGSHPNFGNVSARKRKIEQMAAQFAPDDVLIFGACAVRQGRSFVRYFMVWKYEFDTADWTLLPDKLYVEADDRGRPVIVSGIPQMAVAAAEQALQAAATDQAGSQDL